MSLPQGNSQALCKAAVGAASINLPISDPDTPFGADSDFSPVLM